MPSKKNAESVQTCYTSYQKTSAHTINVLFDIWIETPRETAIGAGAVGIPNPITQANKADLDKEFTAMTWNEHKEELKSIFQRVALIDNDRRKPGRQKVPLTEDELKCIRSRTRGSPQVASSSSTGSSGNPQASRGGHSSTQGKKNWLRKHEFLLETSHHVDFNYIDKNMTVIEEFLT